MKRINKNWIGFKTWVAIILTVLVFIAVISGIFFGVNFIIHLLTNGFHSNDLRVAANIFLWVISFVFVMLIALYSGASIALATMRLFEKIFNI